MHGKMKRAAALLLLLSVVAVVAAGCGQSKADVASHNLSVKAEQFKVARRIVIINGITDKYLLTITGYCSVQTGGSSLTGSLEVTCKTGDGYKKSFIGLSDNVTYLVEQIDPFKVSTLRYTVIFQPSTIVPDIEIK